MDECYCESSKNCRKEDVCQGQHVPRGGFMKPWLKWEQCHLQSEVLFCPDGLSCCLALTVTWPFLSCPVFVVMSCFVSAVTVLLCLLCLRCFSQYHLFDSKDQVAHVPRVADYQHHQGILSSLWCCFFLLLSPAGFSLVLIQPGFLSLVPWYSPFCLLCYYNNISYNRYIISLSVLSHLVLSSFVLSHMVCCSLSLHSFLHLTVEQWHNHQSPSHPLGHPWFILICLCSAVVRVFC